MGQILTIHIFIGKYLHNRIIDEKTFKVHLPVQEYALH